MRILTIVAIAIAWSLTAHALPVAAEEVTPSARVSSNVVVRDAPMGAPAKAIGALRKGETIELLDRVPYYYKVQLPDGRIGYVSKRWTDLVEAAAAPAAGELIFHFIDVGQGDSTLIECPNGATILIDSGSTSGRSPDEVQDYTIDVLGKHGGDLDYLIVSHPDADHFNLLDVVLDEVAIGRSFFVGTQKDYSEGVFAWLRDTPANSTILKPEDFDPQAAPRAAINCGAAKVWILAAAVESPRSRKNAMSIVVMIRMGDFEAVITGDATHDTENTVLSRFPATWLNVDLLRVGHHGSETTSTSKRWADTLSPQIAIVSAGYDNGYGHPRTEVIDRLTPHTKAVSAHGFRSAVLNPEDDGDKYIFTNQLAFGEAVYTTSMSGTIVVRSNGAGYQIQTAR